MLNRREAVKAGALGAIFGFLFRGRGGELEAEPVTPDQKPSAATVTVTPQRAFRPQRLVIAGTVIGHEMVKVKKWEACAFCKDEDDAEYGCERCDYNGGRSVETDELERREIRHVPFVIEDITIGNVAQLAAGGVVPGDMFAVGAPDAMVSLDAAGAASEIRFRVRYTGDRPEGEVFTATMIGTSFDEHGRARMSVLPISSGVPIVA
jgi:hypothetical protein